MWPEKQTACECEQAGWCERHRTLKTRSWFVMCRISPRAFEEWEAGRGPRMDGSEVTITVTRRTDCRFRGDAPLLEIACECCGGRIEQVPVFACEKFQRCVEPVCRESSHDLKTCQTCSEYASKP